ncbi:LysR family transcriptional regulator [Serratia fonticola]|uniref:LysR family transcriptional regulator n=1 Tax=Serratia fonticola TaxID=47917 RepID=UPI0015C5CC54|nr:LysR family transcriptional regulator [Serratia fonticola]NXZ90319.1 LysR family transcriptional regulator [Serratia fonticola]NYA46707.1 LysR family transcriptional regulator [Serratia fonticola]
MIFSRKIIQFLAVAQYGSLTNASTAINITPSAVSQGVHELEQRLGVKLLKKTKIGMSLTNEGKTFYLQIKPCIDEANNIIDNLNINKRDNKTIFIKYDGFSHPLIQENLYNFLSKTNNINLDFSCEVILDVHNELKTGRSDIVITPLNLITKCYEVQRVSLPTERVGILLNKDTLSKYGDNINKLLQIEKLIHTKDILQHSTFTSLKNLLIPKKSGDMILTMTEIETFHLLTKGLGFTLMTENSAKLNMTLNSQLHFIKRPLNIDLFFNRSAYFLADNPKKPFDLLKELTIDAGCEN